MKTGTIHFGLRLESRRRRIATGGGDRAGFSLVELLVVIGIIVLLAALVVAVSAGLSQQSEIRQTQMLMGRVEVMLQEWETAADRQLTWGEDTKTDVGANDDRAKYDLQKTTPHIMSVTELLQTVARNSEVKSHIGQFQPDQVYRFDPAAAYPTWIASGDPDDPDPASLGSAIDTWVGDPDNVSRGDMALIDAWGVPIRAVHPGPLWTNNFPGAPARDEDGTIRTEAEKIYGIARNRRVYFVSAGPDGKFGSRNPAAAQNLRDMAEDNVYSSEVKQP
jgi:prepilin-type N-terminal cleavage/methylation domain-containing protein